MRHAGRGYTNNVLGCKSIFNFTLPHLSSHAKRESASVTCSDRESRNSGESRLTTFEIADRVSKATANKPILTQQSF
jgi:hypothetical protein